VRLSHCRNEIFKTAGNGEAASIRVGLLSFDGIADGSAAVLFYVSKEADTWALSPTRRYVTLLVLYNGCTIAIARPHLVDPHLRG